MKCLLCASCDSLRAVLPCAESDSGMDYWSSVIGSHRGPFATPVFTDQLDVSVPRKLWSKCCIFLYVIKQKHLHKLCHANNCCIRVPMIVKQHCVVIACATVTCGAWYGTFCWLLHCLWFISWSLFSTRINCIIFHKVIQNCVLRWQI